MSGSQAAVIVDELRVGRHVNNGEAERERLGLILDSVAEDSAGYAHRFAHRIGTTRLEFINCEKKLGARPYGSNDQVENCRQNDEAANEESAATRVVRVRANTAHVRYFTFCPKLYLRQIPVSICRLAFYGLSKLSGQPAEFTCVANGGLSRARQWNL